MISSEKELSYIKFDSDVEKALFNVVSTVVFKTFSLFFCVKQFLWFLSIPAEGFERFFSCSS